MEQVLGKSLEYKDVWKYKAPCCDTSKPKASWALPFTPAHFFRQLVCFLKLKKKKKQQKYLIKKQMGTFCVFPYSDNMSYDYGKRS